MPCLLLALILPLHAASYTTLALIRTPCPSIPLGLDTISGGVLLGRRPGPLPHPSETFRATAITNERAVLGLPCPKSKKNRNLVRAAAGQQQPCVPVRLCACVCVPVCRGPAFSRRYHRPPSIPRQYSRAPTNAARGSNREKQLISPLFKNRTGEQSPIPPQAGPSTGPDIRICPLLSFSELGLFICRPKLKRRIVRSRCHPVQSSQQTFSLSLLITLNLTLPSQTSFDSHRSTTSDPSSHSKPDLLNDPVIHSTIQII